MLLCTIYICNHGYAFIPKYESALSYGIIGGLDVFAHPQTDEYFAKQYPEGKGSATKTQRYFPGGGIFLEYRLISVLGAILVGSYSNRSFSHDTDDKYIKTITNVHCIDAALLISLLPKGYGGISFYVGPKMYFIINSASAEYEHTGTARKEIDDIAANFSRNNIGIVGGFKIEIDRTGIIAGAEVEKFLYSMNGKEITPESDDKDKVNEWEIESNERNFSAFGFRLYIGYDFGRLHSGYYDY
jgi:hypothetical protein